MAYFQGRLSTDKVYQNIYGIRYIDDIICRRLDGNADGDFTGSGDKTHYHLTDDQFSTVAILDTTAHVLERVSYDPYGRARHHRLGDFDGDGDADGADYDALDGPIELHSNGVPITDSAYFADGDLDHDGDMDDDDLAMFSQESALASGVLSDIGNVFGFSGYVYNNEISTYTVRFRHYDVALGRWIERDPLGYADSMNMYEYVGGMPLSALDPFGLCGDEGGLGGGGGVSDPIDEPIHWDSDGGDVEGGGSTGGYGGAGYVSYGVSTHGGMRPTPPTIIAPGVGIDDTGIDVRDPRIAGQWDFFRTHKVRGAFDWRTMSGFDWGVFRKELWHQVKEHKWEILLSIVPGGALLKVLRIGLKGRCFLVLICFAVGTEVWTDNGLLKIEDLRPGDKVWSYDPGDGRWQLTDVAGTSEREYDGPVVSLTLEYDDCTTETIRCTDSHPFWVVEGDQLEQQPPDGSSTNESGPTSAGGGKWTEAKWLRLGDHFITKTGKSATVAGLTIRMERIKVYNLAVLGLHNYAVGRQGVLVHNGCGGETAATALGRLMHELVEYGPGFVREFRGVKGIRPDAVNLIEKIVVEIKPDNARAIAEGTRQLERYMRELSRVYGRGWKGILIVY